MRIYSWNINSIRARRQRLVGWLESRQPDVLCLQELKCTDEQFPASDVAAAGYQACWFGQKSWNGVAILSRTELRDVRRGLDDRASNQEAGDDAPGDAPVDARVIAATTAGVRVVSVYAPNGQAVGSPAYDYKLRWYRWLRGYLDAHHAPSQPLVVCGDFNVAPEARDVYDPVAWQDNTLFSPPERAALHELCQFGLADTFRLHHQEAGRYSWWDYQQLGFPKNHGLRIDHILATPPLATRCLDAGIDREARKGKLPSDHAPVWAEFAASATHDGT